MSNVSKTNYKDFFLVSGVLSEQEFDAIADFCSFDIEMPNEEHNHLIIFIENDKPLPFEIYSKLVNQNKHANLEIKIANTSMTQDFSKLFDYLGSWIKDAHNNKLILRQLFTTNNAKVVDNKLIVKYVASAEKEEIENIKSELVFFLRKNQFDIRDIEFELDKEKQRMALEATNARRKAIDEAIKLNQKPTTVYDQLKGEFKVKPPYTPIETIGDELINSRNYINICGEIITVDKKEFKSGVTKYIFVIYDYGKGAIQATYATRLDNNQFSKFYKPMPQGYLNCFKKGDWVAINCCIESNQWTKNQVAANIRRMIKVDKPAKFVPKDDAPTKRVELLMHSNMTAYEGINSATDIYNYTKQCGYKAIGILERNNVQSIPEIFKNTKANPDIKPLYGCEFEVIEKFIPVVVNPVNKPLNDSTYIIFDIETTGLYPQYDDLIEFGAIKYKNGMIVDQIDFFVKPTKQLTNVAINLSHITNEMVANGLSQKDALLKIKQWIGDDVLIAHNGIKFDLNFLNKLCERFKVEPITNCLIDTLEISHAINKANAKHTLGSLVTKLHVDYNLLEAHRADKDCEYLLEVWKDFAKKLTQEYNIESIDQINDKLQTAALRASRRGYVIDVYVKTQKGINSLFKLLSLALTKQLYQKDDDEEKTVLTNGQPKLHFEDLAQYKDDLIVCSHPYDGDLWESAISDRDEAFENKIKKYDYVFVAPIKNIEYLINQDKITKPNATKAVKKIIETATKLGKKVCAVSDAYYLMPYEHQYYEIYVYTKQLGGKRHPLYRHDGTTFVPDFHCLTTKQMLSEFKFLDDEQLINDIVINNTNEFADSIEKTYPINDNPDALCKPDLPNAEKNLIDLVWKTAKQIYGDPLDKDIETRINKELTGICSKGYAVIYWICHLLIEQTNKDGYLVGSRGSVGSSIVAFLSNVSEVNPLPPHYVCPKCKHYEVYPDKNIDGFDIPPKKCPMCGQEMIRDGHNIPFETFLGFAADKLPDIDLNFSGEYQSKAHEFIRQMFGPENAFRAGTIGTVANKTAKGYVKSYFEQTGQDIPPEPLVEALATKCEGVKRTTGQHPGGIVVVPKGHSINEFTPFNYPSNDKTKDWFTTHFEYHSIENNLLKFDILGHDEPTILKHLHDITKVDPRTIPNHDDKVLQLFANSKSLGIVDEEYDQEQLATMGLPEFGTKMTKRIVEKTKPTSVGELIMISGLSHGTGVWQGNAEMYIAQGGAKLSQVASSRESIFQFLADCGMDYAHSFKAVEDIRKGRGLKAQYEKEMMDAHVPQWYIDSCKKIQYLFPKAHATAYVLDALRTAWYKVYYPAQFYAVWFSIRSDVFDIETVVKGKTEVKRKLEEYYSRENIKFGEQKLSPKEEDLITIFEVCLEMFARGINVLNIDINKSQATDFVAVGNSILAPFTSLDGLGKEAAESIVKARNERPFTSINDLMKRTKLSTTLVGKLMDMHVLDNLEQDDQIRLF